MRKKNEIEQAKSLNMARDEEWIVARRSVSIPIEELGEVTPELLVCVSLADGMAIGANVIGPETSDAESLAWVLNCLLSPMAGAPRRPGSIILNGEKLSHLREPLEQLGIKVNAQSLPHPAVDELVSLLERSLTTPGVPPYLSEGVKPETVADFFSAAAEFAQLKPWKLFEFEIPVKLELQRKKRVDYWAVVMGVGGEQFGVNVFRSVDDLLNMFESDSDEDALAFAQSVWSMGFSYDSVDDIGPTAYAEYMTMAWTLADDSHYPTAIVMDPQSKEKVRPPNQNEFVDLTAVTLALMPFFKAHGKAIKSEESVDDVVEIQVAGENLRVALSFPAPEFLEDDDDDVLILSDD